MQNTIIKKRYVKHIDLGCYNFEKMGLPAFLPDFRLATSKNKTERIDMTGALKISLKGELMVSSVFIDGKYLQFRETKEHQYERAFSRYESDGFVDLLFHLEGLQGTPWKVALEWQGRTVWDKEGVIGPQGYTELKELIRIT